MLIKQTYAEVLTVVLDDFGGSLLKYIYVAYTVAMTFLALQVPLAMFNVHLLWLNGRANNSICFCHS